MFEETQLGTMVSYAWQVSKWVKMTERLWATLMRVLAGKLVSVEPVKPLNMSHGHPDIAITSLLVSAEAREIALNALELPCKLLTSVLPRSR
jgi:hypothetical protein